MLAYMLLHRGICIFGALLVLVLVLKKNICFSYGLVCSENLFIVLFLVILEFSSSISMHASMACE